MALPQRQTPLQASATPEEPESRARDVLKAARSWMEGVRAGGQSLVPNPSPKQALGSGMHHELQTLADPDAVARAGAAFVAERARAAVAAHGSFHFAVSGGDPPRAMFAQLASETVPRDAAVIYQVGERG